MSSFGKNGFYETANKINLYLFISFMQRSYILVAISVPRVSKRNNNYKTMEITICVVTHQDHMQTAYNANRNDLLAGIIIEEFNWSDILGFEMELGSDTESILNDTYHLREIKFNALAKNYTGCK